MFLSAALRGATALRARASRSSHSYATVIPYENSGTNVAHFSGELTSDGSEAEFCNQDFLKRGCEFLKRTRKGKNFNFSNPKLNGREMGSLFFSNPFTA
jgi:hypothetical protein